MQENEKSRNAGNNANGSNTGTGGNSSNNGFTFEIVEHICVLGKGR